MTNLLQNSCAGCFVSGKSIKKTCWYFLAQLGHCVWKKIPNIKQVTIKY